ncbi:hypothetical protein [Clostridium sp.]|jgi:hypothetical protein|uniref:hypothetical protein n=1 Tax=Clostridium sp. TaxID=1506 RepID=UPI002588FD52|nr:hypothetical protein [Clostridium sp.]MDF2502976.1 hypothetical protein [Clostridium sp.]
MKNIKEKFGFFIINKIMNKYIDCIFYTLFTIALFVAFIYGFSFKIMNDGFWHIKVGEYIVKNKAIPYHDIFSWYGISKDLKWTSHEWLFGVISYLIYSIDGFMSAAVFMGILNTLIALCLYIFLKIRSKSKWIALLCMSSYIVMFGNEASLAYRPIVVSLLLILITCILLEKRKYIAALVIVVVGINIHGGVYPIYIIVFAYYTLFKNYKYFIAVLMGIFINPYIYGIYLYTIKSMNEMDLQKRYINEWKITQIYDLKVSLTIIIFIVFIYIFGKVKLKDILFSGSFIILAISSVRQIPFLPILALPIVCPYIKPALNEFNRMYVTNNKALKYVKLRVKFIRGNLIKNIMIIAIELILIVPNVLYCYDFFKDGAHIFKIEPSDCPIYAVNYIDKHPEIKYSHLLSHYNDSQYLIFRGIPTFVDSRADLFLPSFNKDTNAFYDFMHSFIDLYDPEDLINKYNIKYILVNKSYSIYEVISKYENLSVVYQDNDYCIFKVNYFINNTY